MQGWGLFCLKLLDVFYTHLGDHERRRERGQDDAHSRMILEGGTLALKKCQVQCVRMAHLKDRFSTSPVPSKAEMGCPEGVCDSSLEPGENLPSVKEVEIRESLNAS